MHRDEILCTALFRSSCQDMFLVQDAVSQLIRKGNRASDANSRMQIARESVKVSLQKYNLRYIQNHVVHVYLRAYGMRYI